MPSTPYAETKCFRLCITLCQICSLLSTHPTRHLPSSGVTKPSSPQKGYSRAIRSAPSFFCLTIQPLVSQLKSELCVWYLDDGTIGGAAEDVKHDLEVVVREGAALGLHLNERKSEVISDDPYARDSILPSILGAQVIDPASASLLGSVICDTSSTSDAISGKTQLLCTMGERLQHVSAHDALLYSFAILSPSQSYGTSSGPRPVSSPPTSRIMMMY